MKKVSKSYMLKKKKPTIVLTITAVIVFVLGIIICNAVAVIDSGNCGINGDNVKWELTENDSGLTLSITGSGGMKSFDGTLAPWFKYAEQITEIEMEGEITSINAYAFFRCNITNMTVPSSVKFLGDNSFKECKKLASISLPDNNLWGIGDYAFAYCDSLVEMTIPDNIDTIGKGAYKECKNLVKITLPSKLEKIDDYVFYNCTSLASVTIPDQASEIGYNSFYNCSSLSSVSMPRSIVEIDGWAFEECNNIKDVYYAGTIEEWEKIIGYRSVNNLGAEIHYECVAPIPTVTRRYSIGKDTWKFRNTESGELKYRDYLKLYPSLYAMMLHRSFKSFSGLCFGYSILIPSIIENEVPFSRGTYDINDYEFEDVKEYLILGQMYQKDSYVAEILGKNRGKLNELCAAVRKEIYDHGKPVGISVWDGGHEVLATSIIKDTPEEVIIGVYDSNFPDNKYVYSDGKYELGKSIYASVRLYGENGNYNVCKWGLSTEEGGELFSLDMFNIDITNSVTFFNNIDNFSSRLYFSLSDASYALIKKPSGKFDSNANAYKIDNMTGEEDNSNDCLYWVEVTDGEYCITNVKANDEIEVALNNKCISVTPDADSDITVKLSDDMDYTEVIVSGTEIGANCKYLETQQDDGVVQTELSLEGKDGLSLKINNSEIVSNGVTELNVQQTKGVFDSDDAELIGETVYSNTYSQIDPDNEHAVNIDSGAADPDNPTPVDPISDTLGEQPAHTHIYGPWITTKTATELAPGQQSRKCSVCGKTETKVIAKLKPSLPAVKITKPKAAKKSATIKWKKVSRKNQKKISKVQIQYSTDKTFKKGVKTVYAKNSATSTKIKKLKSNKTYYVRIRAYKKDRKGIHISKWSTKKSVKVK